MLLTKPPAPALRVIASVHRHDLGRKRIGAELDRICSASYKRTIRGFVAV
jgi:hypothetical protein